MIPQRTMRSSVLTLATSWTRGAACRHITSPVGCTRPSPRQMLLISHPAEGRRLSWSPWVISLLKVANESDALPLAHLHSWSKSIINTCGEINAGETDSWRWKSRLNYWRERWDWLRATRRNGSAIHASQTSRLITPGSWAAAIDRIRMKLGSQRTASAFIGDCTAATGRRCGRYTPGTHDEIIAATVSATVAATFDHTVCSTVLVKVCTCKSERGVFRPTSLSFCARGTGDQTWPWVQFS